MACGRHRSTIEGFPRRNRPVSRVQLTGLIDSEKGHTFFIEAFSKVRVIIRMQFAFGMTTDFVQHPAEIKQIAHLFGWTTEIHAAHLENSLCVFPRVSSGRPP